MGGAFEELADVMYDFPKEYALVFDVVHYVLCLVAVRADMGDEFDRVSTQHPFVSALPGVSENLLQEGHNFEFQTEGMLAVVHDDMLRGGHTDRPPLRGALIGGTDRGPKEADNRNCVVVRPLLPAQGHRLQLCVKHQGGPGSSVCDER